MIPNEKPQIQPTILVVEDEPLLLMIVSETLRDAGYAVWEASDAEKALGIIRSRPEIDLLISDVKMPGMNGYQLVDAGLALRPNLKVMLMTGYAQDPIPKRIKEAGIQVLYKPFDFDKLPGFANQVLEHE
ncbi:MAG TPA: response regulator [Micropepsaceae bacterium]|nr:response regulator [Micropepsaceae bacterium]